MKKKYKIIVLLFIISMNAAITLANPISVSTTNIQDKKYFSDLSTDALAYIKSYSSIPQDKTRADSSKYRHIIIQFWTWMKKTINEEYLPLQSLIINNIVLIPASDEINEDIAYCAYNISNTSFLIVQNSDKIILFTDCQSHLSTSNNIPFKEYILNNITNFMRTNVISRFQGISVKQADSYYIAGAVPSDESLENWKRYNIPIVMLTNGKQICVSIKKRGFDGYAPAWQPLPYEWFGGHRYRKNENMTNAVSYQEEIP